MAGVVAITGTFTTLLTPTGSNDDAGNVPSLLFLDPSDLTAGSPQGMAAIPSELSQFINLCSIGWGFDFWTTAVLITKWMQALTQKGAPSSYSPQ